MVGVLPDGGPSLVSVFGLQSGTTRSSLLIISELVLLRPYRRGQVDAVPAPAMDLKLRNRVVHCLLSHIQPQCIHVTPKHELCPILLHGLSIESEIMPYSSLTQGIGTGPGSVLMTH